jgi:NADP oxidoreductase coenzyme F420-dependent.
MKIAIIGTGAVGRTLASKLAELNHEIMMGTRNVSDKLAVTQVMTVVTPLSSSG